VDCRVSVATCFHANFQVGEDAAKDANNLVIRANYQGIQTHNLFSNRDASVAAHSVFTFGVFAKKMSNAAELLGGGLQSLNLLSELCLFSLFFAQYFVNIFHNALLHELYGGVRLGSMKQAVSGLRR
jgi:hypothetical protein